MKLILVPILLLFFSTLSLANDKRGKREVLLDNSDVEVVRLTYPVGAESGMHTHIHPNRVVYFVKGGTLKLVPKDKMQKTKILNTSDGKTLFLPGTTHNVKNIGNTDVVIVETEIKSS
ncbi:MAG: mannose-6-phosphate isomerase-like protein (cupin superfamily) [Paraglaciecola sp.]|jgi:mannose-6-phosphate isomerase-like protein (cupin superfamily)